MKQYNILAKSQYFASLPPIPGTVQYTKQAPHIGGSGKTGGGLKLTHRLQWSIRCQDRSDKVGSAPDTAIRQHNLPFLAYRVIEMSGNVFFNPIPSHSHQAIPIQITIPMILA